WRWDVGQQRQAPDTREFRVYFQPGPVNTLRGQVSAVATASATESTLTTTIANARPTNAYLGWAVRVGAQSFKVTSSDAGTPLTLRVQNLGAANDVVPARTRCSLDIPPGDAAHVDYRPEAPWDRRVITVAYGDHVTVSANGDRFYELLLPVA